VRAVRRPVRFPFGLIGAGVFGVISLLQHLAPHGPVTVPTQLTQSSPTFTSLNFGQPLPQQRSGPSVAWPPPSAAPRPAQQPLSSISEVKPPPGTDLTLSASQILYCLSQKVRLDAMEPIINLTSAAQVNGFNGLIDDYGLRCLSYNFRRTDMETAKRRVELLRAALASEAKSQVAAWH
jgi:hypothetical protein